MPHVNSSYSGRQLVMYAKMIEHASKIGSDRHQAIVPSSKTGKGGIVILKMNNMYNITKFTYMTYVTYNTYFLTFDHLGRLDEPSTGAFLPPAWRPPTPPYSQSFLHVQSISKE